MPDDPKPEVPLPSWKHNQNVSSNGLRDLLLVLKEKIESTVAEQKKELAKMVSARNSLGKP
jgi:hypothetical protein